MDEEHPPTNQETLAPIKSDEVSSYLNSVSSTCDHIESYSDNFVDGELSDEIMSFLNTCTEFDKNVENGHSVINFGEPYHYPGSKNRSAVPIPPSITKLMEEIKKEYPDKKVSNSCLANKYKGRRCYLPKHADNEPSLATDSDIFTVSFHLERMVI